MLMDWLLLFIIISIVLFILGVYTMEDEPMLAIPIIMINIIFTVLITYGFLVVEWLYVDATGTPQIYTTSAYAEPYSYVFFMFTFVNIMLFIKAGGNLWRNLVITKGEFKKR